MGTVLLQGFTPILDGPLKYSSIEERVLTLNENNCQLSRGGLVLAGTFGKRPVRKTHFGPLFQSDDIGQIYFSRLDLGRCHMELLGPHNLFL